MSATAADLTGCCAPQKSAVGRYCKESSLISDWIYNDCFKGVGKLCEERASNGFKRLTGFGRVAQTQSYIDSLTLPYYVQSESRRK